MYDDKIFYVYLLCMLKFDKYININLNEFEFIDIYLKKDNNSE